MAMEFDTILQRVGEFGRYQRILFYLICIPASLPASFLAYNHLFLSATPDHWCLVPELLGTNLTAAQRRHLSVPMETREGSLVSNRCYVHVANWSDVLRQASTTGQWPPMPNSTWSSEHCQHGWEYDDTYYDRTLVTDMDLVCDKNWWPTFCMAAFNVGSLCGNVAWGWVADRWGRRSAFFLLLTIAVGFASATAFATNYVMYTAFRVMIGFTYPAIFQVPFIIVMELTGPSHRTYVGIMTSLFVGLAEVALAAIAYLVRDWFKLALSTSFPFIVLFGYWWILPESPRWLLSKNRVHEAEVIVQKAARINNNEIPLNFLTKLQDMYPCVGGSRRRKEGGLLDLFRTPNMRRKTLLVIVTWAASAIVYGGLSIMSTSLGVNDYLAFLIVGAVEVPACLLAWLCMDRLGRRWTLGTGMLVAAAACVCTELVEEGDLWTLVCLTTVGKLGISLAFSVLYVFAGELFPTVVRARGMGLSTFIAGLAVVSAPYIVYLSTHSRALPLVIMGSMCVVGTLSAVFLPETLHCHLPETMEEGEEFGRDWKFFACPGPRRTSETSSVFPEKLLANGLPSPPVQPVKKFVFDDSSESDESCL